MTGEGDPPALSAAPAGHGIPLLCEKATPRKRGIKALTKLNPC
jgi:hypothetical protein